MEYSFPTLYGIPSKSNKVKEWTILVKPTLSGKCQIVRRHGYVGFKIQETSKEISSGKNIGKKNETTVYDQALKEAKSMFQKQKESGYSEQQCSMGTTVMLPMLAHDYSKRSKDIIFPCYSQPKIDGIRMLFKEGTFYSRTGKVICGLGHIIADLPDLILDGELFSFDLTFEQITGIARRLDKSNDKLVSKLKFFIFDCVNEDVFSERLSLLNQCTLGSNAILIESKLIEKSEVETKHDEYVKDGYEGLILRNSESVYVPKFRSKDLQKYKHFQDSEFEIIGGKEGEGNDKGTVIFQCNGFWVRPRGTRQYRHALFTNLDNLVGKQLTVRFQNLTEHGVPRFPVGISIRDYE
jgi:DNA ligase-1